MSGTEVIQLYRQFFKYARFLPKLEKQETITKIREAFQQNKNVPAQQIDELLKAGNSRLRFLKMMSPRKRGAHDSGKFIYVDGKWVKDDDVAIEKTEKARSNEPHLADLMKRHNELVARQRRLGL